MNRILIALTIILGLASCSDDNYNGINNSGEVKILSFTASGSKLNMLDEEKGFVELVFPTGTDLTRVSPSYTLSEGAEIVSPSNPAGPLDLSSAVTYTLVNGNLYHDYKVLASHVNGQILSFDIDGFKGSIDHKERTILVRMPLDTQVNALFPKLTITEGAQLAAPLGTTINFTRPVEYVISYLDETFAYTVTVELGNIAPIGFLGAAANAAAISNADDKAAYEWVSKAFPGVVYLSFEDIKTGAAKLNEYGTLWYHHDPDQFDIPVIASDVAVVDALKAYRAQGGGLLLTSAAVKLGVSLEVAKNGRMWNNDWGWGNSATDLGENWGMRFTGKEDHPIFKGLRMEPGEDSRCYILSKGVKVKGHNAIWNFEGWTGYDFNVSRWESENGGTQLASFYWDDAMNRRSTITEYERQGASGAVITIAVEWYDWYHEDGSPANSYRDNLETLTHNILNYLAKR